MARPSATKALELVSLVITDYAGIARGRSLSRTVYEKNPAKTLGWVPANMSLTPFDLIADPNPWGARGDLRLQADPTARFRTALPGTAAFDIVMADILELDGSPWECCPRAFLKTAIADLKAETGLTLIASFEHEFQILGAGWPPAPCFSLSSLRRAEPFATNLMAALTEAGLEPEVFIAEYGPDQYEVPLAPTDALAAADRAVAFRALVRECARLQGWRASFAPKTAPEGVGNGVHIHMSLTDGRGRPAAYDAARPGRLSAAAGAFAAGILQHMPALVALTAPGPVSYFRLAPHHWSAAYTQLGESDREASLRICPAHTIGGARPEKQFNLEYRAADATASPHLALGLLIRAGLEGLRQKRAAPMLYSGDPTTLDDGERQRLGLHRLPASLGAALDAFAADATACAWFTPRARETYTGMKRMELKLTADLDPQALCAKYSEIY